MTSTGLGPLPSSLLLSMSVQLVLCPHLHCLSYVVWVRLCFFPSNVACSALCGIRSTVILSTFPNHRSLHWMTLSSRVVWLPNPCLMSSFLIFSSLVTPVILCTWLL